MSSIRCTLAGVNQTPLDWRGNFRRILEAGRKAWGSGSQFLCLPELAMTGYGCEDFFLRQDTVQQALKWVSKLARAMPNLPMAVGLPIYWEGEFYNALAILADGTIQGLVPKTHLAREGIHYEPRWFRGWEPGRTETFMWNGLSIPMGQLCFEMDGFSFGFEICEDAWVNDGSRPCRVHHRKLHAVFNASASHFSFAKDEIRDQILSHSSEVFGVTYFYTNLLGCESGRAIYDGEMMVARSGRIVARSPRLGLEEYHILSFDLDFEPKQTTKTVRIPIPTPERKAIPVLETKRHYNSKHESFAAAASLGLVDYMLKSRSRGFTISLSGGVDSAVCAILASTAIKRVEQKNQDGDPRLSYLTSRDDLITTVYQATRNSGHVTREAASQLARHLNTRHLELQVDELVEGYKSIISKSIGRELSWKTDDLALQNIQARTRGPSVWMIANLNGSLLLTTSNRSEVAVGYATMDGDTCGGLAPIAGVEKTFLREWLNRLEHEDLELIPKIPCLKMINVQAPTAELRPPGEKQSDENDLMPYTVLDYLEEALVLRRLTLEQAFRGLCETFNSQWNPVQLREWALKFIRMFSISQWKRERYAPSFHLDDRCLDPKTWARFPILSGCFEVERESLANLDISNQSQED